MTTQQKTAISTMRRNGASYIEIAHRLGLSVHTVKSYGRRCAASAPNPGCRQCGMPIKSTPGHKPRVFCSDACRFKWWNDNKALLKSAQPLVCSGCGVAFIQCVNHPTYHMGDVASGVDVDKAAAARREASGESQDCALNSRCEPLRLQKP